MESLKLWTDIIASVAVAITGLFVLLKFAPMIGTLIHNLGLWRGEVNTELRHIADRIDSGFERTDRGFERNDEKHEVLDTKLEKHGERISRLEGDK